MTQPILFNPFDPAYVANPHAFYARLRAAGKAVKVAAHEPQDVGHGRPPCGRADDRGASVQCGVS